MSSTFCTMSSSLLLEDDEIKLSARRPLGPSCAAAPDFVLAKSDLLLASNTLTLETYRIKGQIDR